MEIVEDSSRVTSPSAVVQLLQTEGMGSCTNVPLLTTQGVIGALNVGWEDARAITPEEVEIAGEVAGQAASAIEQARLLQETNRHAAELEQRVAERTAQLEAANHELEAFAYSVSHDLRAPLRAMEGFSTALLSRYHDQLDEQGYHYLDRIQQASQRMGELINDLLNLSRITRSELTSQRVDLSELARAIAAELTTRDLHRQVEFVIAEPLIVQGDAHLLRIALTNLLDNAWKFSGTRQRATIEVGRMTLADLKSQGEDWATHLTPSELSDPRTAIYYVRDNGVGFDMAFAGKLFTPFQRLQAMDEFPGTGIGLAIVQRIIARHGGRVWPNAQVGQGATFYFSLGGIA